MCNRNLLETQALSVELRDRMQAIRQACGHESASHAFSSLFLWQKDMELRVCLREDAFAVRCGHWGDGVWFFPCGARESVLRLIREILEQTPHARLLYLRREDAALLDRYFPGRFRVEAAEDASEYLYDRTEYVTLPGKKNENIRWSINRLSSRHALRVEPLCAQKLDAAREVLCAWKPRTFSESYSPDKNTVELLLGSFDVLELTGVVVYLDERPAAVAMGFPLSARSFDIAFSKAPERETGLLHFARRALVRSLPERFTVINGEEDLGIPGLRQAKRLEHPMGQIEMMEAYAEE